MKAHYGKVVRFAAVSQSTIQRSKPRNHGRQTRLGSELSHRLTMGRLENHGKIKELKKETHWFTALICESLMINVAGEGNRTLVGWYKVV
jgi:hypothetical protein